MSITAKGKRWEILHSLWIGWTFTLGFFNWIAFLYIGLRARRRRWLLWGLFYALPFTLAMLSPDLNSSLGDLIVFLTLAMGVVGILHAFAIRREYLVRLEALQRKADEAEVVLREQRKAGTHRGAATPGQERLTKAAEQINPAAPLDGTAVPPDGNAAPSPSKTDTLIPYEKLFEICIKYVADGYHVGENLPSKKLDNARVNFSIPETERVVALIDATVFGSSKFGLAICEGGVYWRNDWTTRTNRTFLSWGEFASSTVTTEDKSFGVVELGKGSMFNLSGSAFNRDDAVRLLREVQTLAKTVVQENQSDQPKKVYPSVSNRHAGRTGASSGRFETSPEPSSNRLGNITGRHERSNESASPLPPRYPLPLSYSYRLVEAEFETLRILKETYRSAESLTAFLASLTLALTETPTGGTKKQVRNAWSGKGATFGNWLSILEKTTQSVDVEKGPLYRSIRRLLKTEEGPSAFDENIRWLIDRRNELHHSDLPVGTQTEQLIQEARRRLERCIVETACIWEHPLRLVLDYDAVRDGRYVVATCLDYSGDHPVGRKVQEEYNGVPKKQDLYVLQSSEEWIPLYPYISVHYCHHCHTRETYFVDNWTGPREEAGLRSFERAHEEASREIGRALTSRLS